MEVFPPKDTMQLKMQSLCLFSQAGIKWPPHRVHVVTLRLSPSFQCAERYNWASRRTQPLKVPKCNHSSQSNPFKKRWPTSNPTGYYSSLGFYIWELESYFPFPHPQLFTCLLWMGKCDPPCKWNITLCFLLVRPCSFFGKLFSPSWVFFVGKASLQYTQAHFWNPLELSGRTHGRWE